jgi:hypothetical protein
MTGWMPRGTGRDWLIECLILAAAAMIAVAVARPYAGSWNDGSRLATVETLVDQHTWIIDHSSFVQVPPCSDSSHPSSYDPNEPGLHEHGTLDKLLIDEHYYSDKSPVPALLIAGVYQVGQWITGWTARDHPDFFCRAMTLASCGLAFVVAVVCIYRLGQSFRLPLWWRLLLTSSFALGTVALPYAEQVNNHLLLLGVTAVLTLQIARIGRESRIGVVSGRRSLLLGSLAGLAYTIDLGTGPVIFVSTAFFVLAVARAASREQDGEINSSLRRTPTLGGCLLFALSAVPWLALHHALNYWIGGTFKPANANPEYFKWPGSPFSAGNLTGSWVHEGPFSFLLYAASMLAGKRGFLGHNLPLFLCLPATLFLFRRCRPHRRTILWAVGCFAGSWLLYAATSNNSSGQCCTIRWFVPLLAPAYLILALAIRHSWRHRVDFLVLSVWGMLLVALMREGPWMKHMVPFFWPIQTAAIASWAFCHYRRHRPGSEASPAVGSSAETLLLGVLWGKRRAKKSNAVGEPATPQEP